MLLMFWCDYLICLVLGFNFHFWDEKQNIKIYVKSIILIQTLKFL